MINCFAALNGVRRCSCCMALVVATFFQLMSASTNAGGFYSHQKVYAASGSEAYSAPYCGVYSLCKALNTLGISTEPTSLIEPRYISSPDGSSLKDLIDAARERGAFASAYRGMSMGDLRRLDTPALLHVVGPSWSNIHNHWVLFMGFEGGDCRIFDSSSGLYLAKQAEVLAQWDGIGLVISREKVEQNLVWRAIGSHWTLVGLVVACLSVMTSRSVFSRIQPWGFAGQNGTLMTRRGPQMLGMVAILFASAALSLGWHAISETGFWGNTNAVAYVCRHYTNASVVKLGADSVEQLSNEGSAIIVDARYLSDFERGHIPNAINIPIDARPGRVGALLAGYPRDTAVVVYCQSDRCMYAEQIASEILANGYSNVNLFPGGWREWKQVKR